LSSSFLQRLKPFFADREYFRLMVRFTLPIALQNLIMSSLNLVAGLMIGQLGEGSITAVGQANQILFLLNLVVFGIVSGAAMFLAQLWGRQDIPNIRRVLGLTVKLCLLAALVFWALGTFIPQSLLRIYSNDPLVVEAGSQYLRIACWGYIFLAVTVAFGVALRSTGNVRLPLVVSTSALTFNILISYPLIFGWQAIHLPAFGIRGAAMAGAVARFLECMAMLFLVYRVRSNPLAASWRDLAGFEWNFIKTTLKPMLPVIANEALWSFGITTYFAIYGHIGNGTDSVAAVNIVANIDQIAFVLFIGLGTATAIMVGNAIGQGELEKAYLYAGRSLGLQVVGAMLMGLLVYLFAGNIFHFYKVVPAVIESAGRILSIMAVGMSVRAANHVIIIGILRSGGDSRFSLFLDGFLIWLVGVPVVAAGAFILHLPVHLVYALTYSEELTKTIIGVLRYLSKKWIHDLTGRDGKVGSPAKLSMLK
jgi:putative MATE family efflux protein